ncbi:DUF1127 domain-containing protein [Aestuariibius insulae]|uniref:DUF1127 domain-containing protein n=1 Tax=Aestuariibius insulae TaxID=2058287 RepID=UPI00345EBCE5
MFAAHYPTATRTAVPRRTSFISLIAQMLRVRSQRIALSNLDAAALADLGVTRAEALKEANRPFWDLPNVR